MELQEAKRQSLELMRLAEAAVLTTIDPDGYPHTRALMNLREEARYPGLVQLFADHDGDMLIYFGTSTSSNKIAHIRANPRASVYYCLPSRFRGLMLGGDIEIVTDPELKAAVWQDDWDRYYPGGKTDPDYTILKLRPRLAVYYNSLDVTRWELE
jgi:general stress protein 26